MSEPTPFTAPAGWRPALIRLGWSTLSGVLTFLSFPFSTTPDSNWWPLAWISLVPLLWALRGVSRKQAFWLASWMGLVTNFGGFWWVSEVLGDFGHLPDLVAWPLTALNAFYQGLAFALFGWLYVRFRPASGRTNLFVVAGLFTLAELVFPLIFPWFLGNGQYRFYAVIQIADVTGVMGITFLMVAFNVAVFRLVERFHLGLALPIKQLGLVAGLLVLTLGYGVIRIAQVDDAIASAEKLRLGMVEADIGIWEKQAKNLGRREQALTLHKNLLRHQEMSRWLAEHGAELIVWPESSYFPLDDPFIKRTDRFALALDTGGSLHAWRHDPAAGFELAVEHPRLSQDEDPRWHAVAAEREDAWAVVGAGGRVVYGDGVAVRVVDSGVEVDLHGVSVATAPGFRRQQDGAKVMLWAVGDAGTIVSGPPDRLARVAVDTNQTLRAVAMWTGRQGVAVGDGGAVVELGGGKAEMVDLAVGADLHAVWAGAGGTIAAVGSRGTIAWRPPGGKWVVSRHGEATLRQVVRAGDGRVLAAGDDGALLSIADGAASALVSPTEADIVALGVDARGEALMADAGGRVFRQSGDAWAPVAAVGERSIRAIAPLPYVQAHPLPRDIRYLGQSRAPLPDLAAFMGDPVHEFTKIGAPDRTAIQRGFTTPILFGGITWEPPPPGSEAPRRVKYNTAMMLDEIGRVVGKYDKVYLLVFGEYMPFGDLIPGLYDMFPQSGRFTAGDEVKAFDWRGRRIGVMVCYEDILPKFTGELAELSPNIIINVTNDAWFGKTSEPYLHLALSVFRAVENRLVLARATNTGVSAVIDPVGRVVAQTHLTGAERTLEDVPLMSGGTVYGAVGDLFSYLLALGVVVHLYLRRRKEKRTT